MMRNLLTGIVAIALAGVLVALGRTVFQGPLLSEGLRVRPAAAFPKLSGPAGKSSLREPKPAALDDYAGGSSSRLAVLLSAPDSQWLALAQGLQTIGVPFVVTDDWRRAVQHRMVLVYPTVSTRTLKPAAIQGLSQFTRRGGTLVGVNPQDGLNALFGFVEAKPSRNQTVRFSAEYARRLRFVGETESRIMLGEPDQAPALSRPSLLGASYSAIASYEDGTTAITERTIERGRAVGLGFDVGLYLSTSYAGRWVGRRSRGAFEPSVDVVLRFLRALYRTAGEHVVLGTVPDGKGLATLVTHEVDSARSIQDSLALARWEREQGIAATYFINTHYVRDAAADDFFNSNALPKLKQLAQSGAELGSNTVAKTPRFAELPRGTGAERYPLYQPFVRTNKDALPAGATLLGELRVSKYLLERLVVDTDVVSFGLAPLAALSPVLPQALSATGFRFSSSTIANRALSHLPLPVTAPPLAAEAEVFEFPVTLGDDSEQPLRLSEALALAQQLRRYGGTYVLRIPIDQRTFEQGFTTGVREFAWFGTVGEFGRWWSARNQVQVDVESTPTGAAVQLAAPAKLRALTLLVPRAWALEPTAAAEQHGIQIVLKELAGRVTLRFTRESAAPRIPRAPSGETGPTAAPDRRDSQAVPARPGRAPALPGRTTRTRRAVV